MSSELIGIIATAIALGTPILASLRSLRQEIRDVRGDVQHVRGELRDEMKALETRLRAEMQSGFKELTARVINIGDRLSKVEGISKVCSCVPAASRPTTSAKASRSRQRGDITNGVLGGR